MMFQISEGRRLRQVGNTLALTDVTLVSAPWQWLEERAPATLKPSQVPAEPQLLIKTPGKKKKAQ